jgi:hypothetical protein
VPRTGFVPLTQVRPDEDLWKYRPLSRSPRSVSCFRQCGPQSARASSSGSSLDLQGPQKMSVFCIERNSIPILDRCAIGKSRIPDGSPITITVIEAPESGALHLFRWSLINGGRSVTAGSHGEAVCIERCWRGCVQFRSRRCGCSRLGQSNGEADDSHNSYQSNERIRSDPPHLDQHCITDRMPFAIALVF